MQRRFVLKSGLALAALGAAGCAQQEEGADILDIVSSSPNHTTLTAAIAAAGLQAELQAPGPMTLFAPDDEAFAKLNQRNVAAALRPENNALLRDILLYHVVPGAIMSGDVLGQRVSVDTVETRNLIVDGRSGGKFGPGVTVNGCGVNQADIIATNGVVHSIDCVLIPKQSAALLANLV